MKCVICRQAVTVVGKATITLERNGTTLVYRGVPADVCPNCGEEYVKEDVVQRLLADAEEAASRGIQVEIRQFAAA